MLQSYLKYFNKHLLSLKAILRDVCQYFVKSKLYLKSLHVPSLPLLRVLDDTIFSQAEFELKKQWIAPLITKDKIH